MTIFFVVSGVKEASAFFRQIQNLGTFIDPIVKRWAYKVLLGRLTGTNQYPPSPSGSTYQRTGQLGWGWKYFQVSPGVFAFANATTYAIYVVGDFAGGQQARHMRHWWIAYNRIQEEIPLLEAEIEEYLETQAAYQI